MLSIDVLSLRQKCVIEYLQAWQIAKGATWDEVVHAGGLPSELVACHPLWVSPAWDSKKALHLGGFTGTVQTRGPCAAPTLWGYECPFDDEPYHSDHVFPASLGGPALAGNHLWLCRVHNGWKGADLLAYPWEFGRPTWLDEQLSRVERLLVPDKRLNV